MNATDPFSLDGRLVLVCSALDHRNPPAGLRGTLRVHDSCPGGRTMVEVGVEFPQMFMTRAHTRTIELNDRQIAAMLETESHGAFTLVIDEPLDSGRGLSTGL